MYYVAFYNDCERELSQVTHGSLLTLVYNLRRVTTATARTLPTAAAAAAAAEADAGQKKNGPAGGGGSGGGPSHLSWKGEPESTTSGGELRDWAMEDARFFAPGTGSTGSSGGGGGSGSSIIAASSAAATSDSLAGIENSSWEQDVGIWFRFCFFVLQQSVRRRIAFVVYMSHWGWNIRVCLSVIVIVCYVLLPPCH